MGIPVEETMLQFVPTGAVMLTACAIGGRRLFQRLRRH
jgi:hypothetical protein